MKTLIRIAVGLAFYLIFFAAILPAQKSWTGDIKKEKTRALCKDGTAEYGTKNVCRKHGGIEKWIDKDEYVPPVMPKPKNDANYQPLAVVGDSEIKDYKKVQAKEEIAEEKADKKEKKRAARELKKKLKKSKSEKKP